MEGLSPLRSRDAVAVGNLANRLGAALGADEQLVAVVDAEVGVVVGVNQQVLRGVAVELLGDGRGGLAAVVRRFANFLDVELRPVHVDGGH